MSVSLEIHAVEFTSLYNLNHSRLVQTVAVLSRYDVGEVCV